MKKSFILISVLSLLLIGCTPSSKKGTLNCTKTEYDTDGYKITETIVVNYKNNKVTTIEQTNLSEMDSAYIDFSLSFGQNFAKALNEIEGLNAEYSKFNNNTLKFTINIDYNKIDINDVKNVFGDSFDETQEAMYTKDVSLSDFKENILNDYTCE